MEASLNTDSVLDEPGTLFIPTDKALSDANAADLPNDQLLAVLLTHFVLSDISTQQLKDGAMGDSIGGFTRSTLMGVDQGPDGSVKVVGSASPMGMVVDADVPACSGPIHVIDAVLLPAEIAGEAPIEAPMMAPAPAPATAVGSEPLPAGTRGPAPLAAPSPAPGAAQFGGQSESAAPSPRSTADAMPNESASGRELGITTGPESRGSSSNGATIGGGIAAALGVCLLVALAVIVFLRRRRSRESDFAAQEGKRSVVSVPTQPFGTHTTATAPTEGAAPAGGLTIVTDDAPAPATMSTNQQHTPQRSDVLPVLGVTAPNSTLGTIETMRLSTLDEPDSKARLAVALEHMATARPQQEFARQYVLLDERVSAGQGLVNFARGGAGCMEQFAIKFFFKQKEYQVELALYSDSALCKTLPHMYQACDNMDGAYKSESGFVFPPFIVLERGIVGSQWAAQPRRFSEQLTMMEQLAELLAVLHAAGKVHRDIKPANVIFVLNSTAWRLLDFGIVAREGECTFPRCTPLYAAPEVMQALDHGQDIVVQPSQDIWALGVMAYEIIADQPLFPRGSLSNLAYQCAAGDQPYPWERPQQEQPVPWQRSRLRAAALRCLARDPLQRPSAAQLIELTVRMSSATTYAG